MEKKFDEIYEIIYKEASAKLKKMKDKIITELCILIILTVIINIFYYGYAQKYSQFLIIGSIMLVIAIITRKEIVFIKTYQKLVIETLIKNYRSNFNYIPYIGVSSHEYKISRFDESFDKFTSEDLVKGKLKNGEIIQMSEITTYEERTYIDSKGRYRKERVKTFQGLYGFVELNDYIINDINLKLNNFLRKNKNERIEVDSAYFEKKYDLIAKDKIHALKVFTPELVENIVKHTQKMNKGIEIKICRNKIFFRINCGNIFAPPKLSDGVDYKFIKKFYDLINYPIEIIENIIENSKLG